MKKGFTLVELLVVMGLMALMGAMAIGGYAAITRGMSDRAAIDAAKTVAEAARQRANIDQTKIYLYLFDEVVKRDTDEELGVASGVAVAVMPVGRVSGILQSQDGGGTVICDEFGFLNDENFDENADNNGEMDNDTKQSEMRIYNITQSDYATATIGVSAPSPIFNRIVYDEEGKTRLKEIGNCMIGGFKVESKQTKGGKGNANFAVGDLFGVEFAVTRLPPNYTFSNNPGMSEVGQTFISQQPFSPGDSSLPSIPIYIRKPNGDFKLIGNISDTKDGEKAQ